MAASAQRLGDGAGGGDDDRAGEFRVERGQGDHADAGLQPRYPEHGCGDAVRARLQFTRALDPLDRPLWTVGLLGRGRPGWLGAAGEDGAAGGAEVEGVAGSRAVRDVELRPARLHHGQRDRLAAVGHGEVRGRADLLGQPPQGRQRGVGDQRLGPPGQLEHAGSDAQLPGRVPADHAVADQGGGQPVHHGAANSQAVRGLGDGQPARGVRHELQQPQPAIERLGGLLHNGRVTPIPPDAARDPAVDGWRGPGLVAYYPLRVTLRLYDTATRSVRDFVPRIPGQAGVYLCGLTVQSGPHIGHLRSGVNYDVLRRWLTHSGLAVTFVRNITDIDDKVLAKSIEQGEPFWSIAYRNELVLGAAYRALNVLPPTYEPRATGHIPEMHELIAELIADGHAYVADDGSGDVYFDVRSYSQYGALSGQRVDAMEPAADAPGRAKRDPVDFALWKGERPDEPADAYWPSPWGRGRPGWHIECSAMSRRYLGAEFDIHGGGLDLVFPHHENEVAQSRA